MLDLAENVTTREVKDEEQKRIEGEYAKSRYQIKSIKEDENLLKLFNMFRDLHVFT